MKLKQWIPIKVLLHKCHREHLPWPWVSVKILSGYLSIFGIKFVRSFIRLFHRRMVCDFRSLEEQRDKESPLFYSYALFWSQPFARLHVTNLPSDFMAAITIPLLTLVFLLNIPHVSRICSNDSFSLCQDLNIALVTAFILKKCIHSLLCPI